MTSRLNIEATNLLLAPGAV